MNSPATIQQISYKHKSSLINPLNAELNAMCHLLALLAHHILHVSRIRIKPHEIKTQKEVKGELHASKT
jgi:hypothetical protein